VDENSCYFSSVINRLHWNYSRPNCLQYELQIYYIVNMSLSLTFWLLFRQRQTSRAPGRAHLPPTTVFRRLNTTRRCCDGRPITMPLGFSRCNKIPRCSAYDIAESNPILASGLRSGSRSKVNQFVHVLTPVDTQNVIQIHARVDE